MYVYLERWWRRPWPEAIERPEPIQPELIEFLGAELERREKLEDELGERVKQALGVREE
jgi:hypothetical protein